MAKKVGRPWAITKQIEEELIKLMSDGMSQNEACKYVGISKMAIIEYKKRFPEFADRIQKAKLATTKFAYKSVKAGMIKDWKAGAWWLERTVPERFREKKELEISEKPILIDDVFNGTKKKTVAERTDKPNSQTRGSSTKTRKL
jgi:uncharacterized protein YoaH (UPF0181 family)